MNKYVPHDHTVIIFFYAIVYSIMDSLDLPELSNCEILAMSFNMIILNSFNLSIDSDKKWYKETRIVECRCKTNCSKKSY